MSNRLPTEEDGYRMGARYKYEFGDHQFFLFPLDWGAARVADLIEMAVDELGIKPIRYDLPVSPYSTRGVYRRVTKPGSRVRRDMENGTVLLNTTSGPIYQQIDPVDFSIPRYAVVVDDWIGVTGQAVAGGAIWGIQNKKTLNLLGIYESALEAFREVYLPEKFTKSGLVRGLLLPNPKYPIIGRM